MILTRLPLLALIAGTGSILTGQAARSIVGTIGEIRTQASAIEVKPDSGPAVAVRVTAETEIRRVAPGERDLARAAAIDFTQLSSGDRVLATLKPGTTEARRIVVMPAAEIARRNEADREDWLRRSVAGVVRAKSANQITLRMRSLSGETEATVAVRGETKFRRYAPDSVKFSDARPSSLAEVSAGDQLRARGKKSEDGLSVIADEVVFGTFLIKAGSITSVDAASALVTIADLETNEPLSIRVTADSRIKRMPGFGGPPTRAAMAGGGPPVAMRPDASGPPDLSQMIERMPAAKLEDLKPGDTIVVSSAKGANRREITAIMLVANAGMLIRMATMQSQRRDDPGMGTGISGALSGLEMTGIVP